MPHITCDMCGASIYKRPSSIKQSKHHFCSRQCNAAYSHKTRSITDRCGVCGQEFVRKKALYDPATHHFCSFECKREWERRKNPRVTRICEQCGKSFDVPPSAVKYFALRFCSPECAGTVVEWAEIICDFCEKPFKVPPNRKDTARFCSIKCRNDFDATRYRGENNPNWKGGGRPTNYGRNWRRQRKRALKRDKRCLVCGAQRCTDGRELHVHHIVRYLDFTATRKANFLSNLVTLCDECHPKVEHGQIPCPQPPI